MADLFSGHCGVSRAVQALGYHARSWELEHGPQFDLTRASVQRQIRSDARRGKICGAMLGPPCTSFSVARDRTRVIRDRDHPWGRSDVPPADLERLRIGNECMRAALNLIRCFQSCKIPWVLEHPATSKAWYLPEIRKLQSDVDVHLLVTDFCQWGTRWRKRTRLLCGHLSPAARESLVRTCTGRGRCSRTGKPHIQLTGSGPGNIPWTRIAQPYPDGLCHQLGQILVGLV